MMNINKLNTNWYFESFDYNYIDLRCIMNNNQIELEYNNNVFFN